MKIIDLLVKIANGEEVPKYVEYRNWNNNSFEKMLVCKENLFYKLDQLEIFLNDRIKIIEEDKKIEKIENLEFRNFNEYEKLEIRRLKEKLNELIDAVNELKKGE